MVKRGQFLIKNNVLDCFVPRNDGEHRDRRDMGDCLSQSLWDLGGGCNLVEI